jgi:excisionase family DNA binding protein
VTATDDGLNEVQAPARPSALVKALTDLPEVAVPASHLARICGVDVKTVHHWVDAGLIPHFRTPGRHLRFRSRDVVAFLRRAGHPGVPRDPVSTPRAVGLCDFCPDAEASFFDEPLPMLVEVARRGGDHVVVEWSRLSGIDAAAYVEALAAAAPQAEIVVIGPARPELPRARFVATAREAFDLDLRASPRER